MRYISTRGKAPEVGFQEALLHGLAPDGGLYVPAAIPSLPQGWDRWSYVESVTGSLSAFGADDPGGLVTEAADRFDHEDIAPIVDVGGRLVLELFWGPTLSFKDHALQVLARLLARETSDATVLGATSGDTGAAAIEACRDSMRVVMLFPEGRVSEIQRRQMTTVPDPNVTAVSVRGTFDDCQAMVKEAFATMPGLLAVNSINWARIAAQAGYYIHAAARIGEPFDVAVPTGNFGNAYSCWIAKQMGAPIESIVIANNANHWLTDYVVSGEALPATVIPTVAPAMDIQVPSNLERLSPEHRSDFTPGWVGDTQIRSTIGKVAEQHGYLLDPHTAAAWEVGGDHIEDRPQLVVSTAHPAKFADVILESTGRRPELPDRLGELMTDPERLVTIDASYSALAELVR